MPPLPAQGVNYGIQNGCHLSRARVLYFRHNDVQDLERVLQRVAQEDRRSRCVCPKSLFRYSCWELNQSSACCSR